MQAKELVKLDQKIVTIYTLLGMILAVISQYVVVSDLLGMGMLLSLLIPSVTYGVSLQLLTKKLTEKKRKRVYSTSFVTLFFVWATVWILIFNLSTI